MKQKRRRNKYTRQISRKKWTKLLFIPIFLIIIGICDPELSERLIHGPVTADDGLSGVRQTEITAEDPQAVLNQENEPGQLQAISLQDIPEYDGTSPYCVIGDNVPEFQKSDILYDSYAEYGELDSLGRCTRAVANIGRDIMPTEERGQIGSVRPSGWHTVKYDCVDGLYVYNRCHLIGFQLAGANAEPKNLITGTRYLNVEGMLPFENEIAEYVQQTGDHVMYEVIPIFEGENLVASGVEMKARSMESDQICFDVYCYNVQPGVHIDYSTGETWLDESE